MWPARWTRPKEKEQIAVDHELCRRIVTGDEAASQEFYDRFNRLAVYFGRIAGESSRFNGTVVDEGDFAQEAFEYMWKRAIDYGTRENPAYPLLIHVATYARQYLRVLDFASRQVRLPSHAAGKLIAMRTEDDSRSRQGYGPTPNPALASLLRIPLESKRANGITPKTLRTAEMLTRYMGSIDSGFAPGDDTSPGNDYVLDKSVALESLTCQQTPTPEEAYIDTELRAALDAVLETLSENEGKVIRMRFGLGKFGSPHTQKEVGTELGLTAERIRQIESKAMSRLRHPSRSTFLKSYL